MVSNNDTPGASNLHPVMAEALAPFLASAAMMRACECCGARPLEDCAPDCLAAEAEAKAEAEERAADAAREEQAVRQWERE
jgi:hypothetical protein